MNSHHLLCRLSLKRNGFKPLSFVSLRQISDKIWRQDLDIKVKREIENYWSEKVSNRKFDPMRDKKDKYYILSMFPYPSGNLHMGHVRVYTISDTLSRFFQMQGKNVFQPMGWDAFGLPAENAAYERRVSARKWTHSNIEKMKDQLQKLGFSFDWDAEVTTCSPDYYQWTQYIFLKLFHSGLVYQKDALVNWDPVDETVLADEQVDDQGKSWRSGAKVQKKVLKQWFIKTTFFAKSLYDGLDKEILKNWDEVLDMQRHWIGECDGFSFNFHVVSTSNEMNESSFLRVWTRNPEYLNKIQFLTVRPGSMLDIVEQDRFNNRRLTLRAKNPINGSIIPIFVSDSVTYEDNLDVKIGIPEILEEDHAFALENGVEIKQYDSVLSTREEICNYALENNIGGYPVSAKLNDWLISRQRYWGTPIPLVLCKSCASPQPIPLEQLPVTLPSSGEINFESNAIAPLDTAVRWVHTSCPTCGGPAKRVTDTIDTFVDSSWYYLRYTDPKNQDVPFNPEVAKDLLPVDIYIGGKEHAVLHLYYARFMNQFIHSIGWIGNKEPFHQLITQGMFKGKTYKLVESGKYVPREEVTRAAKGKGFHKKTNEPVEITWEKMSKSKGNGVDPETVLDEYGVDSMRLIALDQMAPNTDKKWKAEDFKGVLNWQRKVWSMVGDLLNQRRQGIKSIDEAKLPSDEEMMRDQRNMFVKSITYNYSSSFLFNIVISRLYTLSTSLKRCSLASIRSGKEYERAFADMIIGMAPIAPHFAAQLWSGISSAPYRLTENEYDWSKTVFEQSWPVLDDDCRMTLVCKVNHSVKHQIFLHYSDIKNLTKEGAVEKALSIPKVQKAIAGRTILETIHTNPESYDCIIDFVLDFNEERKEKIENT